MRKFPTNSHLFLFFILGVLLGGFVQPATAQVVVYSSSRNLTGDLHCSDLTIDSGIILVTNGYNIYCTGTVTNNGLIQTGPVGNGGTGANESPVGATGGGSFPNSYGASGGGGGGSAAVNLGPAQLAGAGGNTLASGGSGGTEFGGSCGTGGSGIAGSTPAIPTLSTTLIQAWQSQGISSFLAGGGGGGGAGSGYVCGALGGSLGGSGAFGIYIQARKIIAGAIAASGQAGGTGASGGGGGGGGGTILLAYGTGGLVTGTYSAEGGVGGVPGGNGGAGGNGGSGQVLTFGYGTTPPIARTTNNYTYEVNSNGQLGVIDLNTGAFTQLASLTITLCGLASYQGVLYGFGPCGTSATLYEVNPANGQLTALSSAPFTYKEIGSTRKGLFAFDQSMNLYSIDATTGAPTLVGATGLSDVAQLAVSTGSDKLYIAPTAPLGQYSPLYVVDTKTGVAEEIGPTGVYGIGAMVFEGGTLYAAAFSPTAIYALDTMTGAASFVAKVSGTGGYFFGLASLTGKITSTVQLFNVSESNSLPCELSTTTTTCFSVQQNFNISSGWWIQNSVQFENVSGVWFARQVYCYLNPVNNPNLTLTCNIPQQRGQGWFALSGTSLPLIKLDSTIHGDMILLTSSLGGTHSITNAIQIPLGSSISVSPLMSGNGPLDAGEPELVLVGEENAAVGQFMGSTNGNVFTGLTISGGGSEAVTAVPMTGLCSSESTESASGLTWLTTAVPSEARFAVVSGQSGQRGVKIVTGSVTRCPQN